MCANTDPALWRFTTFLKSSCITHQNNMGISRERTLLEKAKVYWISRDLDVYLPSLVSKESACSSQYKGCQAESSGLWAGILCPAGMEAYSGIPDSTAQSCEAPWIPGDSWRWDATFGLGLQRLVWGQLLGTL